MHKAAVSVIIPCFRCKQTIRRAVFSVVSQTMRPAQVILVDDHSDDGTLDLLHEIQDEHQKGWINVVALKENRGPGEARNAGWDLATQPYVAFLDSDDTWHPQKIEIQYTWMRSHPEVALTGHAMLQSKGEKGFDLVPSAAPCSGRFRSITRNRLLWSNCFQTASVMLRRDLPVRFAVGKYHSEDYLLWLTIVCLGYVVARSNLPLAFMYKAPFGEAGLSGHLLAMERGELATYRRVFKAGYVSRVSYHLLQSWSLFRYFRRVLLARLGR